MEQAETLLKSTAIGTSIPMMHTGLLAELPYPALATSVRARISTHVQAAITARTASETAENEAVRIIEQEVLRVSHRDDVEDLRRKGRDLETAVLARAVLAHVEHRTLVYGKRTVVFD